MLKDAKGCIFARTQEGLRPRLVQIDGGEVDDEEPPENLKIPHKPQPEPIKLSPFYQRKEKE